MLCGSFVDDENEFLQFRRTISLINDYNFLCPLRVDELTVIQGLGNAECQRENICGPFVVKIVQCAANA